MKKQIVGLAITFATCVFGSDNNDLRSTYPQLVKAKDDTVMMSPAQVFSDIRLLLNITQYHPERKIFPKTNNSRVYGYAVAPQRGSYNNSFEKQRMEQEATQKVSMAMNNEKSISKLAIPIIEVDAQFEIRDNMYQNGCFRSDVIFEESQGIKGAMVSGLWGYFGQTNQVNYLGITLPSQKVSSIEMNGDAYICVNTNDAEKLYTNGETYNGENNGIDGKVYRGKAYYKILQIDNGMAANFTSGGRTGGEAMLVAYKLFDKNGKTIFKSNVTWWNHGIQQVGAQRNQIGFEF